MRKSHNILILAFLILSICTAAVAAEAPAGVVNINSADAAQLSYLPRVGAKLAQRIIDYRKDHGSFAKTSDLMQVKGVGDKMFESLSPYLSVEGKTTLAAKVSSPRKARKSKTAQQPTNTASK
jgi:competence ComEA-like helix-hairpin-helix protein